MSDKYLCDNDKHTYGGGYLALSVELNRLPPSVEVNGVTLQLKTSFYVSLLCVKNLIEKHGEEIEAKVLDIFCDFIKNNGVSLEGYKGEFRFAQRETDGRKTLVVMVNISNLEGFFEELRTKLNIEVDTQPTHITLYTLELDEGIGINGQKDLGDLTEVVTEQVPDEIKVVFQ